MRAYYARIADSGFFTRRVRVVEEPVTDYLHWELHVLRARDENGGPTRIVASDAVAPWESGDPVPEIYTLGLDVMYEAVYDESGKLESARKFTDRDLIKYCQGFISDLYAKGEPLGPYFDREIANLPTPQGEALP